MTLIRSIWPVVPAVVLAMAASDQAAEKGASDLVHVRTVETERLSGTLESFSLQDGLVLIGRGGERTELPADDVVQIETNVSREPAEPESIYWVSSAGDAVYARLVAGGERTITLGRSDLENFDLPITRVRELIVPSGRAARTAVEAMQTSTRPTGEDDEVWLANGDRLSGLIGRIDPNGVTLVTDDGETLIGFDVLRRARLAELRQPATRRVGGEALRVRLTLRDGSALTVDGLRSTRDEVHVVLDRKGQQVERRMRLDRIRRIDVIGGRWQWLTRVRPTTAENTPLLDLHWPHRIDRNVLGGPIKIGGRTFERGIGVHSRSRLVYRLDEGSRRFVCGYGLDDESGPLADVDVKILLDGKVAHRATGVRADGRVRRVSIELNGARQVELLVDFGKNGHVQDRFDWVEPAVIRR